MAEVVVYIAHSVDGFIADRSGGLDFLKPFDGYDFGYDAFIAKIDAVIMGANTYRACRTFSDWPYPGRSAIVMTKGPPIDGDGYAVFDGRTPAEIMEDVIQAGRRRIFVVGGGGVVRAFIDARLVKKLILFQIPVVLGGGAPLWPPGRRSVPLTLVKAAAHRNGVVETEYDIS
ncbi:MAG: dihydrofolate reductase [Ancalomicrobiaceae bacterium]|nr:dihydrofolate reductase [Ancalomicrobiaceae bacterium]